VIRFPFEVEEDDNFSPPERRYMTVCLAAFAEKSKAIVMVSDKAVTYGGRDSLTPMQYDTGVKKFVRVGESFWYALIAGDPTFALSVVKGAEDIIDLNPDLPKSVTGMMACFKASYQKRREGMVEDVVLSPRLLTKKLFVARSTELQPLDQEFFFGVSLEAKNLKTNSSLLVCGFDKTGIPHIFSVANPGLVSSHDLTGFHAIGVGATMAISRLLLLESEPIDQLGVVIFNGFDAKVNAEVTQGVGYNWDAELLIPGKKAIPLNKDITLLIENLYGAYPYTPFPRKRKYKFPKNWDKRLFAFCERVMGRAPKPRRKSVSRKSKSKR
jgi:hypothetical protein